MAAAWQVNLETVRRWARRGLLPAERLPSGRFRFTTDCLPERYRERLPKAALR